MGYFDEGAGSLKFNPFMHCWSLGVEEQFYLFPLSSCARTCDARRELPPRPLRRSLAPALLARGDARALAHRHPLSEAADSHYILPSRFWQLGGRRCSA